VRTVIALTHGTGHRRAVQKVLGLLVVLFGVVVLVKVVVHDSLLLVNVY
jgi:hypothetical protein